MFPYVDIQCPSGGMVDAGDSKDPDKYIIRHYFLDLFNCLKIKNRQIVDTFYVLNSKKSLYISVRVFFI